MEPEHAGETATGSWTVIANGKAGSVDLEFLGVAMATLAETAPVRLVRSDESADIVDVLMAHPDTTAVIAGGDGTLSDSLNEVLKAGLGDRAVGLLPGGTGNDFLRGHGVPLDPRAAAQCLLDSEPRGVNALRIADRWAINAVHLGVGASASRRASGLKSFLGPVAYPVAAVGSGLAHRTHQLKVEADSEKIVLDRGILMLAVVIGRTIGGGTRLSDRRATAAAAADLLISSGSGLRTRIELAAAMLGGAPDGGSTLEVRTISTLDVSSESEFPVNVDGNDFGDRNALALEVVPDAWTALLPSS